MRMKKFSVGVVVAVFLCTFFATTALAIGSPVKITNPTTIQAPYCGPDEKVRDPDGINPRSLPVVGDRWNSYIWSLCCFEECEGDDYLVAGTNRNLLYRLMLAGYMRGLSNAVPLHAFDYVIEKLFCGNVPTGGQGCDDDICKDFAAEIWKFPIGGTYDEWEMLYKSDCEDWGDGAPSSFSSAIDGGGNCCGSCCCTDECAPLCNGTDERCGEFCNDTCFRFGPDWGFRNCLTFTYNDPNPISNIYFGSFRGLNCVDTPRLVGFDDQWNGPYTVFCDKDKSESMRAMTTFQGNTNEKVVVVGTEGRKIYIDNVPDDPCCGWCEIATPGDLGGIRGGDIWDMIEYNNFLYVVVADDCGFRLYRGYPDGDDCCPCDCDWFWEAIVQGENCPIGKYAMFPDGMGRKTAVAANLAVCDDCVYLGTQVDLFGVIEKMIDNRIHPVRAAVKMSQKAIEEIPTDIMADVPAGVNPNDVATVMNFMFEMDFSGEMTVSENTELQSRPGGGFIGWLFHEMVVAMEKCPTQVYRFCADPCDEDNWDLVVGDGSLQSGSQYFETSLSGRRDGFGIGKPSKWNTYSWELECCCDELYVTTFDARSLFAGLTECWCDEGCWDHSLLLYCMDDLRDALSCVCDWVKSEIDEYAGPVTPGAISNPAGFDLFAIDPATGAVTTVMDDGFGDFFNMGGPSMACCDETLYVGTANPFWGGQIYELPCEGEACVPEDVVETGDFDPCGSWTLTMTPCDCESVVSGEVVSADDPGTGGTGVAAFFQFEFEGDPCEIELCVDFIDCCDPCGDPLVEGFFYWDGAEWHSLGDPTDGELCVDISTFEDAVFGYGEETAFVPLADNGGNGGGSDPSPNPTTASSDNGGGGCNAGFSAGLLLFLVPLGLAWFKRF